MTVCFLVNFLILAPPLLEILKGMLPNIPDTSAGEAAPGAFLIIASMVGTTVFSGLFLVRTTLVKEAGWRRDDIATQRRDAACRSSRVLPSC